ncbi:winged helix-turn-helix domain-containing protein, partial [Aeromonas sp. HMWF016]|uniref:winged helix-turn-helix domain-containing protein n=1 Tax=Aeromonas sp. HMWF016 TaxID=2056852 RepID=UPI0015E81CBA
MNTHLKFIIDSQITFLPHLFQISTESHVVQLSQKETALLELLCATPTAPVERSTIIKEIWNDQAASDIGLNKAILGLRRKFESLGARDAIRTIPRVGYVLNVVATKAPFHTASLPLEKKLKNKKHTTAAFVLIVAILISITSITIFLNKQNDISFDEIDKGKNG